MEKLRTLPPVQHQPQTIETQPSTNPNAILVFCTGNILVEQGKPLKYSVKFQLVASAPGQYYLHNVIFRFNYAAVRVGPVLVRSSGRNSRRAVVLRVAA